MAGHRIYFTYVLANNNRRLYIGMTNDLNPRITEHRTGKKGFAASYKMTRLVYSETYKGPNAALARESTLKKWRREKKIQLIESLNPNWDALVVEGRHEISRPADSKLNNNNPELTNYDRKS